MAAVATSRDEFLAVAKYLGHTNLRVYPTASGRRFVVECACGWGGIGPDGKPRSTRATEAEAVQSLRHHLIKAVHAELSRRRQHGLPDIGASGIPNVGAVR